MVRTRPPRHRVIKGAQDREYSKKKVNYFAQSNRYFEQFNKILVVGVDNVQSKQMQDIRIALRGKAEVLMGKNTSLRKILLDRSNNGDEREKIMYQKLATEGLLIGNVGLILTNGDLNEIKKILENHKVQAPARQGALSPVDVIVPAGNTGLEPTKTSFFQALNIGTKITKGTVEILKDELVVKQGEKVGSSEATLLQMLNIKPFFYGMQIFAVYDEGSVYSKEILELTDEDMQKKLLNGIFNVTALSLATGFTTKLSFPHVVQNAFKNILAVSVSTDYTFKEFNGEELRKAIIEGRSTGPAPAANAAPAAAAPAEKAAPKEEPKKEEEEDDDMGFGLFD
jgi:large subunit ribosomal protein LP0